MPHRAAAVVDGFSCPHAGGAADAGKRNNRPAQLPGGGHLHQRAGAAADGDHRVSVREDDVAGAAQTCTCALDGSLTCLHAEPCNALALTYSSCIGSSRCSSSLQGVRDTGRVCAQQTCGDGQVGMRAGELPGLGVGPCRICILRNDGDRVAGHVARRRLRAAHGVVHDAALRPASVALHVGAESNDRCSMRSETPRPNALLASGKADHGVAKASNFQQAAVDTPETLEPG